jgi:hypothetical protein
MLTLLADGMEWNTVLVWSGSSQGRREAKIPTVPSWSLLAYRSLRVPRRPPPHAGVDHQDLCLVVCLVHKPDTTAKTLCMHACLSFLYRLCLLRLTVCCLQALAPSPAILTAGSFFFLKANKFFLKKTEIRKSFILYFFWWCWLGKRSPIQVPN